ncbi:alpha/beta fold hydrolase [Treponema sp.]|uniref:alpha/beta fold hydrolase n=1 Tax=Treponema sp. TaxID=166 RepID=UPI00388D5494
MHFGFSYIGFIYLVMLMVPNIIWAKNKPKDYEKYVGNERKVFAFLERIGEVLVTTIALVFSDFNLRAWDFWSLWLVISFILMILYEIYWIRYFKSEKTMRDQYRSFLFFPVAGASLPVIAFFLLGLYGVNILMLISVIILGIGHIAIHLDHEKEVAGKKKKPALVLRILKWVGIVFVFLIFAPVVFTIGVRNVKYCAHYPNFINGIDEQIYIELGGQKQYVLITGKNVSNPVIIYLHGGPAFSDVMAISAYTDKLMDEYTIIGWEQRGTGRTYYKNQKLDPKNASVTFEQTQSDLDELVDYARNRFKKDKVIIMGHSYGTIVGSRYVLNHPEKVSSFVSIGQYISCKIGDELSYKDALSKAERAGDDTSEMKKLHDIYSSDSSISNMLALRAEISKYHPVPEEANVAWLGLSSPYYGVEDVKWFMTQFSLDDYVELNKALFDYTLSFNAFEKELNYEVPVHFISGSEDWICPVQLVEKYKEKISAPEKTLTLIEGAGHSPQFDLPEKFAECVKRDLR